MCSIVRRQETVYVVITYVSPYLHVSTAGLFFEHLCGWVSKWICRKTEFWDKFAEFCRIFWVFISNSLNKVAGKLSFLGNFLSFAEKISSVYEFFEFFSGWVFEKCSKNKPVVLRIQFIHSLHVPPKISQWLRLLVRKNSCGYKNLWNENGQATTLWYIKIFFWWSIK